jgi:hypothetical protein
VTLKVLPVVDALPRLPELSSLEVVESRTLLLLPCTAYSSMDAGMLALELMPELVKFAVLEAIERFHGIFDFTAIVLKLETV